MFRSVSAPELGKGTNPLCGCTGGDSRDFSIAEEEAEKLSYSAISATQTKQSFAILGKDLSRRKSDAGAYLTWLIYRGQTWPNVRGA